MHKDMAIEQIAKALGWLAGHVTRPIKRLYKTHNAVANPARAGKSLADKSAEQTLAELGAAQRGGNWLTTLTTAVGRLALQQGEFGLPYMNEWLNQPEVAELLSGLHKSDIALVPRDPAKLQELSLSLQRKSGDNAQKTDGLVLSVLAALHEGTKGLVKDRGVAAMVQASSAEGQKTMSAIVDGVEALRTDFAARPSDAARALNDQQANKELEILLAKRTMYGDQEYLKDLERLVAQTKTEGQGRFTLAYDATKHRMLDFLARARAGEGDVIGAEEVIQELEALGGHPDITTRANVAAAKGNVEQALRLAQSEDTAECRSAFLTFLAKHKSAESAAESYILDGKLDEPSRFTSTGWINSLATLIHKGYFVECQTICDALSDDMVSHRPYLSFIRGVVAGLNVAPVDRRAEIAKSGPEMLAFGTLDGPEATLWRDRAIASFEKAIEDARALGMEANQFEHSCNIWRRILRLTDERLKPDEVARIQAEMQDPKTAVEAIRLAQAYGFNVDTSSLETYLKRQELLVRLNSEELLAKAAILLLKKQYGELADFIEANWSALREITDLTALAGQMLDALLKNKEFSRADQFLLRQKANLSTEELGRFDLMVLHATGGDSVAGAVALYEKTNSLLELRNVVAAYGSKGLWGGAVPFSKALFDRESNVENALHHLELMSRSQATDEEILGFVEDADPKIGPSLDFKLRKAGALFLRGRYLEARALADELLAARDDVRDLALDLNLAQQSGDWEHFPVILERVWEKRDEFDARTLMMMASMAGLGDPLRALKIAHEATSRADADQSILMNAYMLAVQLGHDEKGHAWLAKAISEQDGPDGPVRPFSLRQTFEMLQAQQGAWQHKSDDFREGKYPVHLAAGLFNAPLTRFLVDIPRRNADEPDARRRMPLPFRNGRRMPVDCSGLTTAALDVTTIFYADQFGFLKALLAHFDEVYVASQIFRLLLDETKQVVFHQPSRVAEAKVLLNAVDKKRLRVLMDTSAPELTRKVGGEVAALLLRAQQDGGLFVHDGEVYDVGSFMERSAELGDLRSLVISPLDVARSLAAKGFITELTLSKAEEKLRRPGEPTREPQSVELGKLYLDGTAIGALQRAGLLTDLINACSEAWIHESPVQEWRGLVDSEGDGEQSKQVIDRVRRMLRAALLSGKVRLLPPAPDRSASFIGEKGMALVDVAASGGLAQLVVLDDRLLNRDPGIIDGEKRRVPLGCLLDMLDLLVDDGAITDVEREDIYHQLRRRCMYSVPLSSTSLTRMVASAQVGADGRLNETAQLKTLREYISRLISADALCTEDDRIFVDALWTVGTAVIAALWEDLSTSLDKVVAACTWIVQSVVPSIDIALHGFTGPQDRAEEIAAVRAIVGMTTLVVDAQRQATQRAWADEHILGKLLPANGQLLDLIAARIEAATLDTLRRAAHDAASQSDS